MSYLRFVTKHRPTVIPGPAPCEALVYNQNRALSPEEYFSLYGQTVPFPRPLGYPGYSTNSNPSVFLVSDANPFTGTHHVRANMLSGTRMMTFDTEQDCPEIVGYTARIEPGDTVTFSCRMMRSGGSGNIGPRMHVIMFEAGPSYEDTLSVLYRHTDLGGYIPTSYTFYEVSEVAPAGSYFVTCAIGAEAEIGASGVVDFDSFSVVVTPA